MEFVTDSIEYQKAKDNALRAFNDKLIDYVVCIGMPAFTLRNDIIMRWGDIPMLLITRDLTNAPSEYYFSGYKSPVVNLNLTSMSGLRPQYNFTTIYVPDLYRETVDLMVKLIPEMKELIFFSDEMYINRHLSWDIENYLIVKYPNIKYKWLVDSYNNHIDLKAYLMEKQPNKGLLLSDWGCVQDNAQGQLELVERNINMLSNSLNPVFSLSQNYLPMGSIGGVYISAEAVNKVISSVLNAMLNGKCMRDLNFYDNIEPREVVLDYPLFNKFGLSKSNCPDNVVFINKPQTIWEKYQWPITAVLIVFAGAIFLVFRRCVALS